MKTKMVDINRLFTKFTLSGNQTRRISSDFWLKLIVKISLHTSLLAYQLPYDKFFDHIFLFNTQCSKSYDCESISPKCSGEFCEIIDPTYEKCLKSSLTCPLMLKNWFAYDTMDNKDKGCKFSHNLTKLIQRRREAVMTILFVKIIFQKYIQILYL